MDIFSFLLANLTNGLIAVGILILGYRAFDEITGFQFKKVLTHENITGGSIVVAAFLLGLSLVVAAATV